jgi:hypothetical protein
LRHCLTMEPRLAWNVGSSYLTFLRVGITVRATAPRAASAFYSGLPAILYSMSKSLIFICLIIF